MVGCGREEQAFSLQLLVTRSLFNMLKFYFMLSENAQRSREPTVCLSYSFGRPHPATPGVSSTSFVLPFWTHVNLVANRILVALRQHHLLWFNYGGIIASSCLVISQIWRCSSCSGVVILPLANSACHPESYLWVAVST